MSLIFRHDAKRASSDIHLWSSRHVCQWTLPSTLSFSPAVTQSSKFELISGTKWNSCLLAYINLFDFQQLPKVAKMPLVQFAPLRSCGAVLLFLLLRSTRGRLDYHWLVLHVVLPSGAIVPRMGIFNRLRNARPRGKTVGLRTKATGMEVFPRLLPYFARENYGARRREELHLWLPPPRTTVRWGVL